MIASWKKLKMFNTIILNFGYVEDSCPFNWVFTCEEGFLSRYEAVQSLAMDLFEAYRDSNEFQNRKESITLKKCCLKFKEDAENKWCAKCGTCLNPDTDGLYEEFEEWLRKHHGSNYNEWDGNSYFGNGQGEWNIADSLYGISEKKTVEIHYAEKILPCALHGKGLGKDYDDGIIEYCLFNTTLDKFKQSVEDNEASIWAK